MFDFLLNAIHIHVHIKKTIGVHASAPPDATSERTRVVSTSNMGGLREGSTETCGDTAADDLISADVVSALVGLFVGIAVT